MKKLVLTSEFSNKLSKLKRNVADLTYLGADTESYKNTPIVAIVGTRKPTSYGKNITEKIVKELVREGVVIISGLAIGIDALAQSVTIQEKGRTIAVLPSGLEKIYPAMNAPLANKILKNNGTLISEYPATHTPRKKEFLERNRIIAALADAVVIPEAAANSGSLNTANHAIAMGIPVFAVPGPITSPMSEGTNYLLKTSAKAITGASDLFKLLNINKSSPNNQLNLLGETDEETLILQKIAKGISDSHMLQKETKLSISDFQTAVTMLEIQQKITQDVNGNWQIK